MDLTDWTPWPASNGFQRFMLNLDDPGPCDGLDLWTRGTLAAFEARNPDDSHFPFVQLFEEYVVDEVALLSGVTSEAAHSLEHSEVGALTRSLLEQFDHREELLATQAINLAYALIAVSRLGLASEVLRSLRRRPLSILDQFEVIYCTWLVDNRRTGAESSSLFSAMRTLIEADSIPPLRAIEACTQAAVWYAKRGDVSDENLTWYLERGKRIIAEMEAQVDPPRAVISSWYRGIAMLRPELVGTRDVTSLMDKAGDALSAARGQQHPGASPGSRVHQAILVRTLLQSKLKQYCYVTPEPDVAEATAQELVNADPEWSINLGDTAEMHLRFGRLECAAVAFDRAVALGPPYVRYHLKSSAEVWARLGERAEATNRYLALSRLGTLPSAIAEQALGVAATKEAVAHFRTLVDP